MNKFIKLLVLLSLIGCKTLSSTTHPTIKLENTIAPKEISTPLAGIERIRYQTIEVKDTEEGNRILGARRSFLLDIFIQSRDPYFGIERWKKGCLDRNIISEIKNTKNSSFFKANLSIDSKWNPGICTSEGDDSVMIVTFCKKELRLVVLQAIGPILDRLNLKCDALPSLENNGESL